MHVVQSVSNGRTASRNSVRSSWTGQNAIRVQAEKRAGVRNVVSRYGHNIMMIIISRDFALSSRNKGGEGKVWMDRVVVQRIGCIFVLNGWAGVWETIYGRLCRS